MHTRSGNGRSSGQIRYRKDYPCHRESCCSDSEFDQEAAKKLTLKVLSMSEKLYDGRVMSVEEIQDIVEEILLSSPYRRTAKAILSTGISMPGREITTGWK